MNYFIFPDIDTTLYQATGSGNSGLDEILEIQKTMSTYGGNIKVSRILMKFDLSEISVYIVDGNINIGPAAGGGTAVTGNVRVEGDAVYLYGEQTSP